MPVKHFFIATLLIAFYCATLCFSLQTQHKESNSWYGTGCPPHATGQFPYLEDCKRFYNCYKGRGQLSICAPGTLFNPSTLECDFPSKVNCIQSEEKTGESSRTAHVKEQYPHNSYHHTHHGHYHQHQSQPYTSGIYSIMVPITWMLLFYQILQSVISVV